jgi:glutathione S-transferase
MNMSACHPGFRVYSGARADIARITAIWRDCLGASGGPLLFGERPTTADAMFAPICSRFLTYDVQLDPLCAAYRDAVLALPDVVEWAALAAAEPQELVELEAEF